MSREILIQKTIEGLTKLSDQELKEVSDFTEFLLNKVDSQLTTEGIQKLTTDSKAYKFLETEEDLYTVSDLKERYR
jgi:hypothetical protein